MVVGGGGGSGGGVTKEIQFHRKDASTERTLVLWSVSGSLFQIMDTTLQNAL